MGRSACPYCIRELAWYELVPVISWLLLRGRCRTCGTRISLQYPIVELLMGGLFIAVGLAPVPLVIRIIGCVIVLFLVAIAVYDLRHTIMPDSWVYSFVALALASSILSRTFEGGVPTSSLFMLFLSGPIVAFPLWFLWRISGGRWMGFGDVKFALGMGWLLGAWYGFVALTLAFIIGALVGVFVLLPLEHYLRAWRWLKAGFTPTPLVSLLPFFGSFRSMASSTSRAQNEKLIPKDSKKMKTPMVSGFTMKSEVPFGPFLILATIILWLSVLYAYDPILSLPEASVFWNFSS